MSAKTRGPRRPDEFTPMQLLFIEQYMLHRSARRAATEAGYYDVDNMGWRLLQNKKIVDEINRCKEAQRRRNELLEDEVLQEMAKVAFVDITDIVNFNGSSLDVKDLSEIPEHVRPAIKKVTLTPGKYGDKVSIELHDKLKAQELLGKYLSMWVDKIEQKTVMAFEDQLKALAEEPKQEMDFSDL